MLIPRLSASFRASSRLSLAVLLDSAFAGDASTDSTPEKKSDKKLDKKLDPKSDPIPSAFAESPTDVAKLRALDATRRAVMLDKAKASTVGVRAGGGSGKRRHRQRGWHRPHFAGHVSGEAGDRLPDRHA